MRRRYKVEKCYEEGRDTWDVAEVKADGGLCCVASGFRTRREARHEADQREQEARTAVLMAASGAGAGSS